MEKGKANPERKKNRQTEYDYSAPNAYFITICTENRKNVFWKDVAAIDRPESATGLFFNGLSSPITPKTHIKRWANANRHTACRHLPMDSPTT